MARKAYGLHATQVDTNTYPDDGSSPVGSNEWNEALDPAGMLGFTPATANSSTIIIASGVATITDSVTVIAAESSTSDTLQKLALDNTNEYDLVYLFADTGDTITLEHGDLNANGEISTVSGSNETLSTTVPTILMRKGNYWYGYGGGSVSDGSISTAKLAADAVTGAKIADDAIDSEHYTDGSVDLAHLSADSVDGTKIADDAINSEHYTDGSIDLAHLSADSVDGTKIADDAIDSEHYTDGSIDNAHIADDAIDSEHYADGSIDNAHIADDAIDSEHYADGSIDNAHIADDQIDSEHYAAGSIDLEHMSSESVDEDNLHISNAGSNGQFLSKQSGDTGGLTWATPSGAFVATATDDLDLQGLHDIEDLQRLCLEIQSSSFDSDSTNNDDRTDEVELYARQIDSNNDGIFCRVKKNGSNVYLQIV